MKPGGAVPEIFDRLRQHVGADARHILLPTVDGTVPAPAKLLVRLLTFFVSMTKASPSQ